MRRRVLIVIAIIALAGVAGHFALQDWIARLQDAEPAHARAVLLRALRIGSWAVALLLAALGAWCWRQGGRVRRAMRFPLPDARLLRNTLIVTGPAARTRGLLLQSAAAGLLLAAGAFLFAVELLVARLQAMA